MQTAKNKWGKLRIGQSETSSQLTGHTDCGTSFVGLGHWIGDAFGRHGRCETDHRRET